MGTSPSLLIVDDTPDNLLVLRNIVGKYLPDCNAVTADSAEEAMNLVKARHFDGALIHVNLPGMNGIELCRCLSSNGEMERVPAILITANQTTPQMKAQALEAGAHDFISRPIDNLELIARIKALLRISHTEGKLRVADRTVDLETANRQLQNEIAGRKRIDEALRHALDEARQRSAETSALLASARAVLEAHTFEAAARAIFDHCKDLIGASAGYVALLSPDGMENEVVFLDAGGLPCNVDPSLPMPVRGLRAEVYRTGQATHENHFTESEWTQFLPQGHTPIKNVLFAPISASGKVVGLLGLANKPQGFDSHDIRLATAFGEFAAVALSNTRATEMLETSEERFRSVVQTATDAIVCVDTAGKIVFWNRGSEAAFGYRADEIIGQPLSRIIPEKSRKAHQEGFERYLTSFDSRVIGTTLELHGLRKDGTQFPLELSLATWRTAEGQFFTGIIRNITERRQANDALQQAQHELEERVAQRTAELNESNARLRREMAEREHAELELRASQLSLTKAQHIAHMGSWDWNVVTNELKWSDEIYRIFGISPSDFEATYDAFMAAVHPDDRAMVQQHVDYALAHDSEYNLDHRIVLPDGEVRYVHEQGAVTRDTSGRPIHMLGTAIDITPRKRAEERARQHQQQLAHVSRLNTLGEMTTAIAHELNQPLTAILGCTQSCIRLFQSGNGDPADIREGLEEVAAQAKRSAEIIRHLRDFSRKRAPHRSTIEINDVVREALNFMAIETRSHQSSIHIKLAQDLPPLLGDTIELEQVIVNLVRNGLEAMAALPDEQRELTLSTALLDNATVEVAVSDKGSGVPEEVCHQVFDAFYTTKKEGIGIGLSLSRSIIEAHGGRLWVTPNSDRGVTFRFSLPLGTTGP